MSECNDTYVALGGGPVAAAVADILDDLGRFSCCLSNENGRWCELSQLRYRQVRKVESQARDGPPACPVPYGVPHPIDQCHRVFPCYIVSIVIIHTTLSM